MSGVGPIELFILLVVLVFLVIPVWAIIDAIIRPGGQWAAADQNKVLWIVLLVVGTFVLGPVGLVLSIVYFVSIRPKLTG